MSEVGHVSPLVFFKGEIELFKLIVDIIRIINTGSKSDDLYWTSGKNSLELIELSSINKVSLV